MRGDEMNECTAQLSPRLRGEPNCCWLSPKLTISTLSSAWGCLSSSWLKTSVVWLSGGGLTRALQALLNPPSPVRFMHRSWRCFLANSAERCFGFGRLYWGRSCQSSARSPANHLWSLPRVQANFWLECHLPPCVGCMILETK